jgi:4'-phosphopantetheinyl transferase
MMKRVLPCRRYCRSAALPVEDVATSFASDAIEIVITRLDTRPEALPALAQWLSEEERRRADRHDFDRDRRRFIVARARLRQSLALRLMTRPEAVELVYGTHGKPALAQGSNDGDWRFSVSHCDEMAVYAFSQGREVGIDFEAVREVRDADAIVSQFFSRSEQAAYRALDPGEKMLGFFNCWTRKEAFLKALGLGLSHPLDCFDVSLAPGEPARILRVKNTPGCDSGWTLDSFTPSPGFVAAVVTERRAPGVEAAASSPHPSISNAALSL